MVDEIGVEREGSFEFRDRCVVLALEMQGSSKLSASLRQASRRTADPASSRTRPERSGTEIITIVVRNYLGRRRNRLIAK
jgi:hypothetical protein